MRMNGLQFPARLTLEGRVVNVLRCDDPDLVSAWWRARNDEKLAVTCCKVWSDWDHQGGASYFILREEQLAATEVMDALKEIEAEMVRRGLDLTIPKPRRRELI